MNDSGYEQYYGDEGEDEFYEETAAVAPRGGTAGPRRSVPEVIHGQVRVPPPTALQTAKLQEDHNHDLLNNKDGQHQQQATSSNAIPTTMSVNYLGNPQGNISTNRSSPTPITPSSSSSSSSTCRDQDIISPSLVTDNEDVQDEDSEADRNPRDITSSGIPNPDSRPVPMTPQTNSYYASTSANTNTNTNTYQGSQQQNAPSSTIATTNPYNHMYGYGHHHHNPTANSNFLAAPANPFSRQQHNDQIMEEEEGQDSFSSIQQQHLPNYFNNHSTSLGSTPAATAAHAFDDSLRANDPLDSISTHGERTVDSTTASTASLLESNQGYNQNYHNVNNINNSNNHSYQHQETYSHNNTLLVDQSGWNYQTQQQQQQQQQQYSQTISDTRYGGHYHQEATSYETSEPQARPGYPADHNYNQQQQYHNSSQNPRQHEEGNWRQQQQQQQPAASTRPRLPSTGDTCHPADVTRPAISYSGRDDALMSDRSQPANVTRPSYLSGNDVAMSDRSQPAHVTRPSNYETNAGNEIAMSDRSQPADVTRPSYYNSGNEGVMSDRSQPADVTRPSYCSGNEVASISWQRQGQGTTYLSTTSTSTHGRFQSTRERRSANNGAVRRSNSTASAQGQGRDSTLSRLRSSEGESAVPRLYPGLKGRRNVDFFHLRQGMNPAAHRQQPSMPEPQEQQRSSQESTLLDEPNAVDGHDVAHQRSEFDTTTGEASTGIAVAATSTSFDQTTERRTGDEDFTGTTDATTGTVNATEVSADIPSLTSYEDKNKLQQSDPPSRDLPVSSGHSSAIAAGVTPSSPLNAGVHHQQQQSTPSETPDLSGAFSTTSTSTVSVPGASFNADNSMYVRKAGLGGGRRSSETANNLQQQTPPSLQRYASVGTGDSSIRTPGLRRFQSVGGATGSNEGGSPHPRRVPGLRRRESIESGALGTISGDNNPIGPREPNFRRHESVGNSTISTVSTVSTVSNGGGGASVPGASFSTDNGFIARKAALSMRRSRMEDTSMDGSSYSIDSMNASMVSVPGASFSTDNGAYARKAGLRGRASVRSNRSFSSGASSASSGAMEDESSRSMPGASRENDGEQASAKEGKHMARSQDSLRTVDENIKMRGAGGTPNSSFRYQPGSSIRSVGSGTQTMQGREDSYRAQMDGSIGTATTDHNIEELEERYRAKVGAESRPGAVSSNDTQAADAINAKLERHFGPTLESQEQERGDRFSHISLLSPRRPESTTLSLPPTISIRASVEEDEVSEELDREEFDMEFEAEVVPVARSQGNLPRELTVDQDVAREQATFPIGDNKERLWFFTPTGIGVTCAIVVVAIISIVAAVATRSKGSDEVNYDEVIADAGLPFTNTLPSATKAILEEQDPDAPQYMAYQWLQEEDLFLGYPLWRKQQRFAMATIYFALYHSEEDQDMPWFEHDTDECDWLWSVDDLSKCDSSGRYEILSLRLDYRGSGDEILVNGCRGPNDNCTVAENGSPPRHEIPPEIGLLSIEQLNVAHVKSTTPLSNIWPAELFNLTNSLVQLTAKESRGLTGTIPTFVGLLSNLEVLSVEQTSVTGGIPTQIGECRNLQELIVSENPSLSGRLPTELGIMSNLELMWIFDNQNLTGPVPSEFGTMPNLLFLSLDGNDLTSTIPTELGLATTLNEFRLGRNDLSGTVPSELGALSNLRTFALQDNDKLSGTMPLLLCKLDILMFQYFVDCTRIECCTSY